jgi:16S rRNA (guanine966-N2)-methyltransferase
MRIIAGELRSRRLMSMPGMDVRPTPDKLRQTLFDILNMSIEGTVFVDAYAGTGAVGIEALSRGARHVVFIEKDRDAVSLIKSNLKALGVEARARVIHGPAAIYLGGLEADFVFMDPPYPKEHEYQASLDAVSNREVGLVIVQHASRFKTDEWYGPLRRTRVVKQGDNSLSFFRKATSAGPSESLEEPGSAED